MSIGVGAGSWQVLVFFLQPGISPLPVLEVALSVPGARFFVVWCEVRWEQRSRGALMAASGQWHASPAVVQGGEVQLQYKSKQTPRPNCQSRFCASRTQLHLQLANFPPLQKSRSLHRAPPPLRFSVSSSIRLACLRLYSLPAGPLSAARLPYPSRHAPSCKLRPSSTPPTPASRTSHVTYRMRRRPSRRARTSPTWRKSPP